MFNHIRYDFPKLERTTTESGTRVYKTPSGRAYPSITTITGLLNKQSIMEWRARVGEEKANKISSTASRRGTRVHTLCEKYLKNETVLPDLVDRELWDNLKNKLNSIDNILALETPLYSDHLEVAGTVDCIAEYENKLAVIDFKTSSKVKREEDISHYFMQCSAYAVAFEELTKVPVSKLVIIMAVDNEGTFIYEQKRDNWIDQFIELRNQYRAQYNC